MRAPALLRRVIAVPFALLLALSACSADSTDAAGGDSANPKVRLAVGIDASYAPFFLAAENGLFTKQGVDVEIVQFGRGGEAVDALASGQIQLAGSSETTTIGQLQQNPDLRALLVYEESGEYVKVVTGSSISDPSQIKKMGIVPGLSELSAIKFLQSKGIDLTSVEFVSAGPPEMPALLQQGDIDAFVLWEPWPTKGVELGGKVFESTGDFGWSYVHWLITDDTWLRTNEQTAAKVAAALDEAVRLTESDPSKAAEATEQATKIPPEQTVAAVEEIDFATRDITAADLAGYETVADFYVSTGKLKTKPQVADAVLQNWFSTNTQR